MGSIVLLPLYLQTVMGYTAFLAGLVLGPGAALTLVTLPLAGKLTERVDARWLLGFGLVVCAYSCYYMCGFNGQIDFETAIIGRVIQGIGMPFIFVESMYVAMAYIPKEEMNNASAIFNLLRNLGGSFGIAFVATLLEWRSQFHQAILVSHLTQFNPLLSQALQNLRSYLQLNLGSVAGSADYAGRALYNSLLQQASILAFDDVFYAQAVIFLVLVTILWIINKPPIGKNQSQPLH
jgi:DHA2 family multidrug resistance protein